MSNFCKRERNLCISNLKVPVQSPAGFGFWKSFLPNAQIAALLLYAFMTSSLCVIEIEHPYVYSHKNSNYIELIPHCMTIFNINYFFMCPISKSTHVGIKASFEHILSIALKVLKFFSFT